MKQKTIIGTAMGLAAIAVLIDHTRHPLPESQPASHSEQQEVIILCGLDANPCGLDRNPCGLSPCGLSPGLEDSNPCSL